MRRIPVIIALSSLTLWAHAQNQKVQFNGTARGDIENNWLPKSDTSNIDQKIKGNTLVDLRMDIKPSDNIKIKTDIRFSNPMGGFWGQGAAIQLRHISLKGVASNFFKYRFGDIDLKMTPYTLFNNFGDLSANESEIFRKTREINEEENFNFGNYWHQQGADLAFRLGFDKFIKSADFSGFVVRNRSVTNNIVPDRLHAGGNAQFNINNKSFIGFNYINLFDLPKTVNDTNKAQFQNSVITANFKFDLKYLYLFGEGGISKEKYIDTNKIKQADISGNFFEAGLGKKLLKNQLSIEATFRRVSDDFYSAGAQTRRINYMTTPQVFNVVSNTKYVRGSGIFDLVKDPTIYNPTITPQLMNYSLLFNHVTPYGKATPNRTGFDIELAYKDSADRYTSNLSTQLLQDTRGEGTTELRNYALVNWNGTLAFDKIYSLKKTVSINAGVQYAKSQRDGKTMIKDVDLATQAIDAGATIELISRLDLLFGTKLVLAKGTEYTDIRNLYNQVTGFNQVTINGTQMLHAVSFRYRFTDNVIFSIQGSTFQFKDKANSKNNYAINQIYMLFNMKF
jgi:hypothetical protein